jgi:NADH-quinone oxidoreductase subunit G
VLRVLGNLLELNGFEYETSEAIRNEIIGAQAAEDAKLMERLNNACSVQPQLGATSAEPQLERLADVPIYFTDAIVRRAESLQQTNDALPPKAWMSSALAAKLGIADGSQVKVSQGAGSAVLTAAIDKSLPDNVLRVAAAHASTSALGAMFGSIAMEKA